MLLGIVSSFLRLLPPVSASPRNRGKSRGGAEHLARGGRAAVLEGVPTKSNRTSWGTPEILNVLDQVPKTQQPAARRMLREVMYAPTQAEAERKRGPSLEATGPRRRPWAGTGTGW